jgi:hypothetical protein
MLLGAIQLHEYIDELLGIYSVLEQNVPLGLQRNFFFFLKLIFGPATSRVVENFNNG